MEDILRDPMNELPGADSIKEDRVFTGRRYDWNSEPLYKCYYDLLGPSRHLSVLFCTFVYLQVFNMMNSRKIHDEVNIFKGIFSNPLFITIMLIIAVVQAIIIMFVGKTFEVSDDAINSQQWLVSMLFSLGVFPVDLILKFVPDSLCPELGKKQVNVEVEKKDQSFATRRRSSGMHRRVSMRIGSSASR